MNDPLKPVDAAGSPPALRTSPVPRTSYFVLRTFQILLLLSLPVYVICLGANSIWDANEAFYVDTPRQMVLTGDYVTPWFNGVERLNKPVLSYWLVAGLYHLFGVSVGVERLGIAMGALGIIAATYAIGRALHSSVVGVIAALMVATAPRMVMFSRRIFIDIYITLFMAVALACFAAAERYPDRRRPLLLGMYAAIGLGVLTKGPVALVLPGLVGVLWIALERRWSDVGRLMLLPGAAIVIAIVAPWYVALYVEHGWDPIRQFFVGENLERYTSAMVPGSRGMLFYLPVLFGDLFPWAPLLVVPLVTAWRPTEPRGSDGEPAIRRLLWLWIVAIVGVFSLSQTKQDLYIFPVIPAVAALVAHALVTTGFGVTNRTLRAMTGVVAALTVGAGLASYWLFGSGYFRVDGITAIVAILGVGGAAALVLTLRGRLVPAIATLAASFVLFNYVFVVRALPGAERLKPSVPIAGVIDSQAGKTGALGAYNLLFPSLVYYVGRPIAEFGSAADVHAFFDIHAAEGAWVIMSSSSYDELVSTNPRLCVVDRRPLFEAKLSDLISRQPPADVLLVSNRCALN